MVRRLERDEEIHLHRYFEVQDTALHEVFNSALVTALPIDAGITVDIPRTSGDFSERASPRRFWTAAAAVPRPRLAGVLDGNT